MLRYARSLGKKAIDFYRTAPFSETLTAISASYPVYVMINGSETYEYVLGVWLIPVALTGAFDAHNIFRRKRKLKEAIKEHGWDARLLEPNTKLWCHRQIAKMVAEENGRIEDYNELYQRKKEEGELLLAYVPNF